MVIHAHKDSTGTASSGVVQRLGMSLESCLDACAKASVGYMIIECNLLILIHTKKSLIFKCYFSEELIAMTVPTGFEFAACGSQKQRPGSMIILKI